MKRLTIIGAAAYSLALVAPAMAASGDGYSVPSEYRMYHGLTGIHRMTAQDFDHQDLGIARPTYHSGWGGIYGDGDYPGTVDQNMGPPYWGR